MNREWIAAFAEAEGVDLLLLDDLDEAFIGIATRCGQPTLAVYSWERIMKIFVERDGMSYEEAAEFIDYNITGAWVGEKTPIILDEACFPINSHGSEEKEPSETLIADALMEEIESLEEEVLSLGVLVDALKRLQEILLNDLDAWGRSCPKLLRRWMIGRMEKRRAQI